MSLSDFSLILRYIRMAGAMSILLYLAISLQDKQDKKDRKTAVCVRSLPKQVRLMFLPVFVKAVLEFR